MDYSLLLSPVSAIRRCSLDRSFTFSANEIRRDFDFSPKPPCPPSCLWIFNVFSMNPYGLLQRWRPSTPSESLLSLSCFLDLQTCGKPCSLFSKSILGDGAIVSILGCDLSFSSPPRTETYRAGSASLPIAGRSPVTGLLEAADTSSLLSLPFPLPPSTLTLLPYTSFSVPPPHSCAKLVHKSRLFHKIFSC